MSDGGCRGAGGAAGEGPETPEYEYLPEVGAEGGPGPRLDVWLASAAGLTRSQVRRLMDSGCVSVNGLTRKAGHRLEPGDVAAVRAGLAVPPSFPAEDIPLTILYEDGRILAIDKPKGMVMHPGAGVSSGTLANALLHRYGGALPDPGGLRRPGIVHRLDKDTTGVVVVGKDEAACRRLSDSFRDREVEKEYVAVVAGVMGEGLATVIAPIGRDRRRRDRMAVDAEDGKDAVSKVAVLERFRDSTYVKVLIATGRTHQIRVHLAYMGHPVVGDGAYAPSFPIRLCEGQALHARRVALPHPDGGARMEFAAPLPAYFGLLLRTLREGSPLSALRP